MLPSFFFFFFVSTKQAIKKRNNHPASNVTFVLLKRELRSSGDNRQKFLKISSSDFGNLNQG